MAVEDLTQQNTKLNQHLAKLLKREETELTKSIELIQEPDLSVVPLKFIHLGNCETESDSLEIMVIKERLRHLEDSRALKESRFEEIV